MTIQYGGKDEQSKKNRKAYDEGAEASRLSGDNPYPRDSQEWKAWEHGFKYGK
jgi:hypothetical protein